MITFNMLVLLLLTLILIGVCILISIKSAGLQRNSQGNILTEEEYKAQLREEYEQEQLEAVEDAKAEVISEQLELPAKSRQICHGCELLNCTIKKKALSILINDMNGLSKEIPITRSIRVRLPRFDSFAFDVWVDEQYYRSCGEFTIDIKPEDLNSLSEIVSDDTMVVDRKVIEKYVDNKEES